MPQRRLTRSSQQRVREQLEWLDLEKVSAAIYGNRELEQRLEGESQRLRRLLGYQAGSPSDRWLAP